MCLILIAVRPDHHHRLVVAANRDEFYGRPTDRADFWDDNAAILAGRDLEAGGTWLGITRTGRFAAVTNFREDPPDPIPPRSRGALTSNFLNSTVSASDYAHAILEEGNQYRGFNLLIDDGVDCYYASNRRDTALKLNAGFYGLSNQLLDCDWPKVNEGRDRLNALVGNAKVSDTALFDLLSDRGDGSPFSNSFIATAEYGTCASTVVTVTTTGDVHFVERGYQAQGKFEAAKSYDFTIDKSGS